MKKVIIYTELLICILLIVQRLFASYLRCFNKYADLKLKESHSFQQIGSYAIILTQHSKALVERAVLNGLLDHEILEKEMCESGISFIRKFVISFKDADLHLHKTIIEEHFSDCKDGNPFVKIIDLF